MRILHFFKTYYPDSMGGTEQVINQLSRSTKALGIDSEVLTLSANPNPATIELDGHYVHRVKTTIQIASTDFSIAAFKRFSALVQEVDVVHYHFPWPFMDVVHFATRVKKPTVVSYHSDIVRQKTLLKCYKPLQDRFLSSVDRIAVFSPNYLESSKVLSQFREKTRVIPIGIDQSTYPIASAALLQKWRDRIGPRFFLFVGVLRYYKGLHILLDALKDTNYPVVIMGAGPTEIALKDQAQRLGLQHVHFTGALPDEDKVALLELCYAFVFPSHLRSEAFGISLLEAAMFGKPMISCEIGTGTSFVNLDQQTGLVVPPSDPNAFKEAMKYLWENPSIAEKMGVEAAKRYLVHFTAKQMTESYAELYRDLV